MTHLYASITGCEHPLRLKISESHDGQIATATAEVETCSLNIGDAVEFDFGYEDNHSVQFTGYVKDIQLKEPERLYTLMCSDVLIRASEFYIVSSNPEAPMTRSNIDAGDLVRDVINECGLTDVDYDLTNFICGVSTPIEINLTTSYDFAKYIADLIAYNLWADKGGGVNFYRRLPWVTEEDVSIGTIPYNNILHIAYGVNDKNLRNRVVVYGAGSIYAEASEVSPYLPEGYYKTACVSAPQVIDTQEMADLSAEYNLELYNKLSYSLTIATIGTPSYYPRQTITVDYPEIDGASRDWYIFSAEHSWGTDGYTTEMELRNYG